MDKVPLILKERGLFSDIFRRVVIYLTHSLYILQLLSIEFTLSKLMVERILAG